VVRRLVLAGLLAACALVPAHQAAAEQNWVAYHYAQVTCYRAVNSPYQMIVLPTIQAYPTTNAPGTFSTGSHEQWVAFQVNIFRSTDNVNFVWDFADSWVAGKVGEYGAVTGAQTSWYDYDSQQWGAPLGRTFDVNESGFYRAAVRYYWFADNLVGEGRAFEWANDHYDSTEPGYFLVSKTSCRA
jgi:hypothetical protein